MDRSHPLSLLPRVSSQEARAHSVRRRKSAEDREGRRKWSFGATVGLAKHSAPNSVEGKHPKSSLTRGTRQKHTVSQTLLGVGEAKGYSKPL